MNKIHKQRIYLFILFSVGVISASGFILYALKQNINVFMTPSQLQTIKVSKNYFLRLGGLVKKNSVSHSKNNLAVEFIITDLQHETRVRYVGVLPDLFREEKGVIAEGKLAENGTLMASTVLAKHDENYMPKNVYKALRKAESSS